jgi:hypothetical protein
VAGRSARAVGDVRLAAAPHIIVELRTDIAAGRLPSPLVAALSSRDAATSASFVATADEVGPAIAQAAGRPLVLVTDGLAGDAVVAAVRAVRPDTVVVDVGPATEGGRFDAPVVCALGNSAASAAAVIDLLLGPD